MGKLWQSVSKDGQGGAQAPDPKGESTGIDSYRLHRQRTREGGRPPPPGHG